LPATDLIEIFVTNSECLMPYRSAADPRGSYPLRTSFGVM
jgi:hypothetical protein